MGNESSRKLEDYQNGLDLGTPPRKKAKLLRGSFSLRSIASLASSSSRSVDKRSTDTEGGSSRKRKHTSQIPQSLSTQSMVLSVERYWPALIQAGFEPDFPWRSDVSESDFVILNSVGNGRFGNVYRASFRNKPNEYVAIKVQSKVEILKSGAEDQIRSEVRVQRNLNKNQFIAEFIDVWQTQNELFTVMEYVDGYGDLFTLWSDYGQFSEELVRLYGVEIALGLDFLHQNNVIHRDLKMENIALDIKMHIKFVDFGFAKKLNPSEKTHTICGTLQYMAPEIAKGLPYGEPVDWWSYGVTLYVMRTGYYPFPNSAAESHEELVYEQRRFTECCSLEFVEIVQKLLTTNSSERLTSLTALFSDTFFNNVNIEGIYNKIVCPWELLKNESKKRGGTEAQHSGYSEHYSRVLSFSGFDEQVSAMELL